MTQEDEEGAKIALVSVPVTGCLGETSAGRGWKGGGISASNTTAIGYRNATVIAACRGFLCRRPALVPRRKGL